MGAFIGLNYQSADFIMRIYEIEEAREIFECLQLMEAAALELLNDKATR